jgi:hypothetical protein
VVGPELFPPTFSSESNVKLLELEQSCEVLGSHQLASAFQVIENISDPEYSLVFSTPNWIPMAIQSY